MTSFAPATAVRLHPDVESALDRLATVDPVVASRLGAALRTALAPVAASRWAEVAWAFSILTGDGMPVELAFTGDGGVRATTEVAGPEAPDGERLAAAAAAAVAVGGGPVHPVAGTVLDHLGAAQRGATLRYGAWLSVRPQRDGSTGTKLYAEIPRDRQQAAARSRGPLGAALRAVSPLDPVDVAVVGVAPATGFVEVYTRGAGDPDAARRAATAGGLGARTGDLVGVLDSLAVRPVDDVLASRQTGWSTTCAPDGTPIGFALHVAARLLFGGDRRARPGLLDAAAEHGWVLDGYAAVTAPLAGCGPATTPHGLVSLGVATDGPVGLQIGVRPFAAG